MTKMSFSRRYVRVCSTACRFVVPVVWLVLAVAGGLLTPHFLKNTNNSMGVPSDAPSRVASRALDHLFPKLSEYDDALLIYVDCINTTATSECNVLDERPEDGSLTLHQLCAALCSSLDSLSNATTSPSIRFRGWCFSSGDPWERLAYVSARNRSTIIPVQVARGSSASLAARWLQQVLQNVTDDNRIGNRRRPRGRRLSVTLLGTDAFMDVIQSSVEHDMAIGDGVALPLSLAILALTLRSVRLLLLPLYSLVVSGLTSFGIMYFFSLAMPVMSATMSLMSSLLIAFTLDYSLFLLSRYTEELRGGADARQAVHTMLVTAGHTCIVSGLTIACAFFGLLILPQPTLRGIGCGSGVAVLVILAAQLTLVPAALLVFPDFFAAAAKPCPSTCCSRIDKRHYENLVNEFPEEQTHPNTAASESSERRSRWYRFSQALTRFPVNLIVAVLVVGVTVPFAVFAWNFPLSNSVALALPQGNRITEAYSRMNEAFGYGYLEPLTLVIVPRNATTVLLTDKFFDTARTIVNSLVNCSSVTSFFMAQCHEIPPGVIVACQRSPTFLKQCPELLQLFHSHSSNVSTAATVLIQLPFDPNGPVGGVWYKSVLRKMESLSLETNTTLMIAGGGGWDGVDISYRFFPLMIVLTCVAVLVFVGVAFKSIIIPLRAVLTIAVTLMFCFGWASLVYVHGALSWTHFWGFKNAHALLWMPPLVSFTILAGLSLDYDLFVLVRVKEFFDLGNDTAEAIALGMDKSGRIVTSAGLIMAVAFSGLLFSSTAAMNQLAFFLVWAVLFDTFVVRTLLVPTLFSLGAQLNWWPGSKLKKCT